MRFLSKKGVRCEKTEDGAIRCRIFKADGTRKLTSGTDVKFIQDSETCRTIIDSPFDLIEDDEEDVEKLRRQLENGCKGGFN